MNIKEIVDLHGKLAERIKQFESSLDLYPPIEVSNEIRYALRAAIELLEITESNGDSDQFNHAIQKTYHALLCAYHDLVDGLVLHITSTLDELREVYLEESIIILGDRRAEIIDFINEVNEQIALSRKLPRERKKIYDENLYDGYFNKLLEYRRLLTGRIIEDVVKLNLENQRNKRRERNKYLITTILAIAAIIITIIIA